MTGRRESSALAGIGSALSLSDPRLAGMFGMFTRLAEGEAMPAAEQVRPRTRRFAATVLALPVLLLALLTAAAAGCRHAAVRGARLALQVCRRTARGTSAMPLQRDPP